MSDAIALTPDSKPFAERVHASTQAQQGLVYALDLTGGKPVDAWHEWIVASTEKLMLNLGEAARDGRTGHVVTVVKQSSIATADSEQEWRLGFEQAAVEAVRGVMGSLALERVREGLVANTVVVNEQTSSHDIDLALNYLLDPALAQYTIGATLHLTSPGYPSSQSRDGGRRTGTALITGAGGTIGFATAQAFKKAGYDVILSDLNADALAARAQQLPGAQTVTLDVTDRSAVHDAVASGKFGDRLAAVVPVHGFQGSARLADLDTAMIESSHAVNGTSVIGLIEETLPLLERHGNGALTVVSSQCGIRAETATAAYCAPKFALIGLQKGLSARLAERGINFNTLCPGPVDTAFLRVYFERFAEGDQSTDEVVAERSAAMPVGRFARPEEMGEALRFLAQLDATGVLLAPTGGETLT